MKKFFIISTVLILLAAGAFGWSLYHYMQSTGIITEKPAATEAAVPAATEAAQEETVAAAAPVLTGADVFAENMTKAQEYVANLSKEQMTGQLILGICADSSSIASEINRYSLAGMLFRSDNFTYMSPEDITAALKTAANDASIKPVFAAQEEGGNYTTFSDLSGFSEYDFNSPRSEFAANGLQGVEKAEDAKAELLKSLGINLNLAPSVDLAAESDQIMYSRSVSENVETVSAYAEYVSKFTQARGVSVALKHFPGYGTLPDSAMTYTGAVTDERSAESIRAADYEPFKKGAESGAHFIMVSNVFVKNLDAVHTAALSPAIHNELRNTVGFKGIILTDVLDETDFSEYAEGRKPVVQAVLAGNDMILVRDYATAYSDILAAVNDGTIPEDMLKEACTRVIAYKYTAGIMK